MRIGTWQLDAKHDRLLRDGQWVKLQARATAVLVRLAQSAGEVVSKDELIDSVWNGNAVSDHSVAIVISDLRKALGDDRRNPTFIETIPKRGYRLIVADGPEALAPTKPARRRTVIIGAVIAAIIGAVAVAGARLQHNEAPPLIIGNIANASGNPRADTLAFAVPDLLLGYLGEYPGAPLVRLNDGKLSASDIDPDALLFSGNLARTSEGLSLSVNLKRMGDGKILWSDRLPLSSANLASNVHRMAGRIALEAGEEIDLPPVGQLPPPAVQDVYWEGRRLASRRDEEGLTEARLRFLDVLKAAPGFAGAHSALAHIYAHKSGEHLGVPRLDTFAAAQTHLTLAERLGGQTAETMVTRVMLLVFRDRDPKAALAEARRAVARFPESPDVWQALAMTASVTGDDAQALSAIGKAINLEPSRADFRRDRVWMLYAAGRYADADKAAAALSPSDSVLAMYRALIRAARGDKNGELGFWIERARFRGLDPQSLGEVSALASSDRATAMKTLARAVEQNDVYRENEVALAAMYRSAGDSASAARVLRNIRRTRDSWLWLWVDRLPQLRQA